MILFIYLSMCNFLLLPLLIIYLFNNVQLLFVLIWTFIYLIIIVIIMWGTNITFYVKHVYYLLIWIYNVVVVNTSHYFTLWITYMYSEIYTLFFGFWLALIQGEDHRSFLAPLKFIMLYIMYIVHIYKK